MHRYEVIIYWSAEDHVFVAEVPELPGCAAPGFAAPGLGHQAFGAGKRPSELVDHIEELRRQRFAHAGNDVFRQVAMERLGGSPRWSGRGH